MNDYERGQWAAFHRVLSLLQTYDTNTVDRKELYRTIFELRPVADPDRIVDEERWQEQLDEELAVWLNTVVEKH